eukprot:364806-Chlamydomonas_euryale.AAC.5
MAARIWPWDQFCAARQLENVPESGAIDEACRMAPQIAELYIPEEMNVPVNLSHPAHTHTRTHTHMLPLPLIHTSARSRWTSPPTRCSRSSAASRARLARSARSWR